MLLKRMVLPLVAGVFLCSCATLQKTSRKKNSSQGSTVTTTVSTDTAKKAVSKVKPYKEVITAKAITDSGLFKVHRVDDHYFFEIPDSLLDKDILIVNRISKAAAENRPGHGYFGFAGDNIGENVVQFSKGPGNKLFIKRISYQEVSKDSTANGMYRSVHNSNLQPIVAAFEIKAFSPDSKGTVIDLTDYINGDNDVFFFNPLLKKAYGLGAIQSDKSYIGSIQSFPLNLEIHTIKTYSGVGGDALFTYELNSSLVLLPQQPMQPRYSDERVGYFSADYIDFDANPQGVELGSMITRWRLEPREEDIEKYKRGELVEPKKPIVFYIDPTTPKKWVSYLIQGVNDWQKAFEKAGFKNAIYALEAPLNDPEWSLDDARHNAIVYKPAYVANASGPNVHDPRTGEILETHINWYHNVMELVHNWYMVQAGAIDPKARKMEFDDSLMGQLIRFVSSHEVGHTLGLLHNFGASSTVPVDSLRSKQWVEANGICPSIMDYARFNYVAQPEDSVSEKGIFPRIGVYDKWAIEWGYRWLPALKTREEEKAYLNHWIIAKLEKDKRLWFGSEKLSYDPRRQSEDLGDNAMKAGYYGIKNLKRILPKLIEWTKEPNKNYESLKQMSNQVVGQYMRYLLHVAKNVGGHLTTRTTVEQKGVRVEVVSREQQQAAVQFLQQELFTTPYWLINKDIFALTGEDGSITTNRLTTMQLTVLATITGQDILQNLIIFEGQEPTKAYTVGQFLTDLEKGIWEELAGNKAIDLYRRNLQKIYAERLIALLHWDSKSIWTIGDNQLISVYNQYNDIFSIIKGHAKNLIGKINYALPGYKDETTRLHLMDVRDRLQKELDPLAARKGETTSDNTNINGNGLEWKDDKIGDFEVEY